MLTTIFNIVGILTGVLSSQSGTIGNVDKLINGLLTPVQQLIASLKAKSSVTNDILASLAAASGVIAVLKATTGLSPDVLTQIDGVDKDIQTALTEYAQAGTGYDATLYTQDAPVA